MDILPNGFFCGISRSLKIINSFENFGMPNHGGNRSYSHCHGCVGFNWRQISVLTNLVGGPSILQLGPSPCSPTFLQTYSVHLFFTSFNNSNLRDLAIYSPFLFTIHDSDNSAISRLQRSVCLHRCLNHWFTYSMPVWFQSSHLLFFFMNLKQGSTGRENLGSLIYELLFCYV